MAGNPNNAGSWANADVLIGPITAVDPVAGAAWGTDWKFVGLLKGDDGFGADRSSDSNDIFAWGGVLIETTDKNYKETKSFTALEDNDVVQGLINPGSTLTFGTGATAGQITGTLVVPVKTKFKIGFELRRSNMIKRRISKNYATLDGWPTQAENEDDAEAVEITVAIYPTALKELWSYYRGPAA